MTTPCFWVEPSGLAELSLRRYLSRLGNSCAASPYGYCDETVAIGRIAERRSEDGYLAFIRPEEFIDDPRWPTRCSHCGREFGPVDPSGVSRFDRDAVNDQVNQEPIYRAADGREWPMDRLAPGAMFDATWRHDGPGGISLTVVTPYRGQDARIGFWHVDCPASNSDRPWDRTGDPKATPPTVSATPSILTPHYHGFLQIGPAGTFLTDDIGGHS